MITRCWSYVGQVRMSGGQPVSIGRGCGIIGTVLHEIMHALGFFHTSSRHDRDSYVVVIPENIRKGKLVVLKNICPFKSHFYKEPTHLGGFRLDTNNITKNSIELNKDNRHIRRLKIIKIMVKGFKSLSA